VNTAEQFLHSLACRDFAAFRALLAPDVWCRAMLVREVVEVHTADETTELFGSWFGTPPELHLEEADHHPIMGRTFVRYRIRLRPAWAPDTWHRIEQTGYLTVVRDVIGRVDLACTGFYPA
jgi:hypothetical protein